MAGSFYHVLDGGRYRGVDLLENMGDMHEAVEEMAFMLLWLKHNVLNDPQNVELSQEMYYQTYRGEIPAEYWWPKKDGGYVTDEHKSDPQELPYVPSTVKKPGRKVIQTSIMPPSQTAAGRHTGLLVALCDDGTMWCKDIDGGVHNWMRMESVPQPGDEQP